MATSGGDKLRRSVERGMLQALAPLGFKIVDAAAAQRGATLTLTNESTRLELVTDWLEGSIDITVHTVDGQSLDLTDVIAMPKGAGISRLPRGVRAKTLGSRLAKIGDALAAEASALLLNSA